MKKLSIKEIVEFRGKSVRAKKNFATNIQLDKPKEETDGGGDYWITSLSAVSNSYRLNKLDIVKDKIDELEEKYEATDFKRTKTMYKRNIDILYSFEDFDFKKWRPYKNLKFVKKHRTGAALTIKGLQLQTNPHHVFTFGKDDAQEIGAIWFIAKLGGYKKEELGMFTDILFRYLKINFGKEFGINLKYCIAVDVVKNFAVSYDQIQSEEVPVLLSATLDEIKKLM
ncbi:MAG: hypothetical protein QM791_05995 [Ferruginibacter sp.]